jgi:hypothetical protein
MNFDLIYNIGIIFQHEILDLPVLMRHQCLVQRPNLDTIVVNDIPPLFITTVLNSTALAFQVSIFPCTVLILKPFATTLLGQT